MTYTEIKVETAKRLHLHGMEIGGHHVEMGYLRVVKEIRARFDLSYAGAMFIMTLAGIDR